MPYVGRDLQRGNYLKLDDISSSFDGSTTTFNLTSGGNAFFPGSAFSIIVSLGGVIQEPESAFQIDKSQIIFAAPPSPNDDFFCIVQGVALGVGVPGHNTVNNDQLAKPLSYGDYFRWDSANNRVGINTLLPSTALDVVGNATFSGNVSIGGTLTYEDVANIDAVGIITARAGIEDKTLTAGRVVYTGTGGRLVDNSNLTYSGTSIGVPQIIVGSAVTANSTGLSVTGITTLSNSLRVGGTNAIVGTPYSYFYGRGNGGDGVSVYAAEPSIELVGTNGGTHAASLLFRTAAHDGIGFNYNPGGNVLELKSFDATNNNFQIHGAGNNVSNLKKLLTATSGAGIQLYHNNDLRFSTTGYGATVFGTTETQKLNVTGISTFEGNIDANGNLDVDGQTDLDDVSITGVTTALGLVNININASQSTSNPLLLQNSAAAGTGSNPDVVKLAFGSQGSVKASIRADVYGNGAMTFHTNNDTEKLRITAAGVLKIERGSATDTALEINTTATTGACRIKFNESGTTKSQIAYSHANDQLEIIGATGNSLAFFSGGSQVWNIDTNGHLLPNSVGAVNIGSASAEIGDVYIADNKKAYFGSDQDFQVSHNGTHAVVKETTGRLYVLSDNLWFKNQADNSTTARFLNGDSVLLYYAGDLKLQTTNTGITVTGEVATSQDYPNFRPVLDFNFAATKKLKPGMTFTRNGEASFHDGVGSVKFALTDEPRFEHDIVTGECKGLMFEGAGTNYSWYSRRFDVVASGSWVPQNGGATPTVTANTYTAPDGTSSGVYMADTISGATGTAFNGNVVQQQHTAGANVKHTFSMYIKLITSTQATIYIRDGSTGSISSASAIPNTRNWQRVVVTSSAALTNSITHSFYFGNTNGTIAVWGSQIERSDHVTSYIKTEGGANGTRNTDKGVHLDGEDVTDVFNQGEGTLIAEAILTQSLSNNPIVGFYEDFASNNRLELRGDASSTGVARFEAVVGGSTVTSLTSNLQHSGVNNVSKYAYAFQENNYAGCVNGGSVTTDTSSTFPHGTGIDSMMIGEAVYSVDAAVIVKRIMYYADRLPNSQLVTLTS